MARVKSLLRRSQQQVTNDTPDVLEVGPLEIKKDSHEVTTLTGRQIQLTALEFGILYLLASHPNRVFSADEIFERVWQQNQTECLNGFPQCKAIGEFKEITKNYVDWFNSRRISQKTKA